MSQQPVFASVIACILAALGVSFLAAASPTGSPPAQTGPPSGQEPRPPDRYWLAPDYVADRDAYEAKRDTEYQEGRVLDIAGVGTGMTLGEVGAGNGYFALKLARRVGPSGKVYANDIVENFLAETRDRAQQQGLSNIETVLGTETDPRLPAGRLEMVFLVRVLHDLARPADVLRQIAASLKPGARVVVVETEVSVRDERSPVLQARQEFLDVVARTPFVVDRIDKSLPNPRSVVLILSLK